VQGQEISMAEEPETGAQVIDLMEALRASLEKKPAAPASDKGARGQAPAKAAAGETRKPPKRALAAVAAAAPKKVKKNA
jgi:DNA end-binding protein Ku